MAKQLHKSFSDQQVRALLKRSVDREVELRHILGVLGIGRSRFFEILRQYRDDPGEFTVAYRRTSCPRKLSPEVERNILKELELEKRLIEAPRGSSPDLQLWKKVLQECRIELRYALSPQAKGKIERPPGWLQDRVVRTCARKNVKTIGHARKLLGLEKPRYNNLQVHSTTGEIPVMRFRRALKEKRTLFRPFEVPPPFRSTKDVFSLFEVEFSRNR